jgi:hypothetical protein
MLTLKMVKKNSNKKSTVRDFPECALYYEADSVFKSGDLINMTESLTTLMCSVSSIVISGELF